MVAIHVRRLRARYAARGCRSDRPQWGAGRTFGRGVRLDPDLPYKRLVEDGLEVTRYALRRLQKSKLILLGHSLGSALGVHMVKERPELFCAFLGTEFFVSQSEREAAVHSKLLRLSRQHNDTATLMTLERVGPPPYRSSRDFLTVDEIVRDQYGDPSDRAFWGINPTSEPGYVFTSPELTIGQMIDWYRAIQTTIRDTVSADQSHGHPSLGLRLSGPRFRPPGRQ